MTGARAAVLGLAAVLLAYAGPAVASVPSPPTSLFRYVDPAISE